MKNKSKYFNWRFVTVGLTISICLLVIIYRIFSIQIIDSTFLQNEGAKRHIKYKDIIPVRGSIFDRNNVPLAVSVVNYDLYALKGFKKSQLLKLSELIELDIDYVKDTFEKKTLLKKNVSKTNLLEIEQPHYAENRQKWIDSLLANQFTMSEIENGVAYKKVSAWRFA